MKVAKDRDKAGDGTRWRRGKPEFLRMRLPPQVQGLREAAAIIREHTVTCGSSGHLPRQGRASEFFLRRGIHSHICKGCLFFFL